MKLYKSDEGFFLLDAVISLLVVSVVIIEILVFSLNMGNAVLKTNVEIIKSIEGRNRSVNELYEIQNED